MAALINFLIDHKDIIGGAVLAISELLALIFPSDKGFGGIVAGLIKFLKQAMKKPE